MGPKNAATGPTDHGLTVPPPPPPAPPAQEEMKLEYTDVHKRFKTLVDDLLTGFLSEDEKHSYGRPVGVAVGPDGRSILMADDVGNVIWRIAGA